jgi:malonyl-CoA decarboxylase
MADSPRKSGPVERLTESVAYGPEIFARFVRALKGGRTVDRHIRLAEMANSLLSLRGEASGVALARQLLDEYLEASEAEKLAFLLELAREFGPDLQALERAVSGWTKKPTPANALVLQQAAESRRQELIRRMNQAPGGTAALVRMREDVLRRLKDEPDLASVDADFAHLLASWFNRGFLRLERIDWSTPAEVLERIIRYEAVHAISSWDDLRRRIDPPDRRCFGFFHPALGNDPLVFVEVALTQGIPGAIGPLLAENRKPIDPRKADTAIFYSISNCHLGLRGVSFGNFLIKQVVEELSRAFDNLQTFATLSPIPGFTRWLTTQASRDGAGALIAPADRSVLLPLTKHGADLSERALDAARPALGHALLAYLFDAKDGSGKSLDPVSRFHLGNGARLDRIHWPADLSSKGIGQSLGFMVSYVYALKDVEHNHEAYVSRGDIAMSAGLARSVAAMRRRRDKALGA